MGDWRGQEQGTACLQKPIHHSLPLTPVSSLGWPGFVFEIIYIVFIVFVQLHLRSRVCQLMEIMSH